MTLDELYGKKGALVTQIEIAQAQLQEVNKSIVEEINKLNKQKDEKPNE